MFKFSTIVLYKIEILRDMCDGLKMSIFWLTLLMNDSLVKPLEK